NSSEMNYYARWFNIVIREMVGLKNFKEEENWIANQFNPPLTESEVRESLINLEKLGLIVRNSKGRLELNNLSLNTNNEVYSSLVALYHKKMLELASNSIDKVPREERELSALCLPVSEVTAKKIKKKIQEFREELLMIVAEDKNAERVYQVNMQLFPLTKKVKETA
ncbi:MAG: DUF4423 domain-containing protein, partial [Bdellovibrionales bacterium]|nr:DUF4423 domain-containing protein [Bdellovibrionales bacterium]